MNRRWNACCRRSCDRRHLPASRVQQLALLSLAAAVVIGICGCGFLSSQRGDNTSSDLTRGQQPLSVTDREPSEELHQIVQRANALYADGRLRQAQKVLNRNRQSDSDSTTALELEARIALDLGDMPAYRTALNRMLAAQPESAAMQNRIGKRLVDSGQRDEGLRALGKAYELAPQTVAYARDLAAACLEQSDDAEAAAVLTQALRWNPRDATIPVALARYHEAKEDWQEASRYYDVALKSAPENSSWLRQKARCLYRLGEYADACDMYSACIESNSSSVALSEYAEYGDACLQIGDVERAQMVYDRISRYSAVRSREVELLRVICAIRRGDSVRGQRILRDALVLWPNDADLLDLVNQVEPAALPAVSTESP